MLYLRYAPLQTAFLGSHRSCGQTRHVDLLIYTLHGLAEADQRRCIQLLLLERDCGIGRQEHVHQLIAVGHNSGDSACQTFVRPAGDYLDWASLC